MATYAIGDLQGCYFAFQHLLAKLNFDVQQDRLWLVGDLINRGTGSLEVLRWCYQHQQQLTVVLGNHDLHAIAVAHGIRPPHRSDTLAPLLVAKDGAVLLDWLRQQALMVCEQGYAMVHAGLLPQWTLEDALGYAEEVQAVLRGGDYISFLTKMYGNEPDIWRDALSGTDRWRVITNAFTRLRVCDEVGRMDFAFKGEVQDIPDGLMPWFRVPSRRSKGVDIICGHWSALGLHQADGVIALDTGCLWGGQLTAFCLETRQYVQVPFDVRDRQVLVNKG